MLENPLEPIEELILTNEKWFDKPSFEKEVTPKNLEHVDYDLQMQPILEPEDYATLKDLFELGKIQGGYKKIDLLKEAFDAVTINLQKCVLNLKSEEEIKKFLRNLFDSITFMKNELTHRDIIDGVEHDILNGLNDYILYRYINKGFSKIDDKEDVVSI